MAKIDLVTGFLGSGKTTFIKKYVRYLLDKGERVGIIENDYGAISVDLMLLDEELGQDCGLEMVVAGDMDCYRRRFKTKLISMGMLGYDRVIVEPSGIFDVDEFFDILYEEPLDRWYQMGNVIAIVDEALEENMSEESEYLLVSQIADAGTILLSKVTENGEQVQERTVAHMNRALEKFTCDRRYVFPGSDILAKPWGHLTGGDFEKIENCGYVAASHSKRHVSEENEYQSLFFYHVVMAESELLEMKKELFEDASYGRVYRVKGFVKTPKGDWLQLNATAAETDLKVVEQGQEVLIVIGEALEDEKIRSLVTGLSHEKDITTGQTAHGCHHNN